MRPFSLPPSRPPCLMPGCRIGFESAWKEEEEGEEGGEEEEVRVVEKRMGEQGRE